MDVSISQKRKRSSTGLTFSQGTEVDDVSGIKSRKLAVDVVVSSMDISTIRETEAPILSITTSKTISPSTTSISDESDNFVGAYSGLEKSLDEPNSTQKKILQRQWTAEAHRQANALHSTLAAESESDETNLGPTIGHKKINSRNRGTSTSKYNATIIVNGDQAPTKFTVTKEVPLPRAPLQASIQSEEAAIDTLPLIAVTEAKNLDENNVTPNIIIQGSHQNARNSDNSSQASLNSVAVPEIGHNDKNDDRGTANIPAREMSHVVKKTSPCLTFLSYCAVMIVLCLMPTIRRNKAVEMQIIEEIPRAHTSALLAAEIDQPVFARSSFLLNQLTGLEQEVMHLSDILESAADVHAEAQVLMYKSREDEENLRLEAENSIRDIGYLITALEESSLALGVSVQDNQIMSEDLELSSGVQQQAIAGRLENLLDEERDIEASLLQVEGRVEGRDSSNKTISSVDRMVLSNGDKMNLNTTAVDAGDKMISRSGGVNVLVNPDTNRTDITVEDVTSPPYTETGSDISQGDNVILQAIESAENVLTALEEEIEGSLDDIDTAVRDHVFAVAEEVYQRPAVPATGPVSDILNGINTDTDGFEVPYNDDDDTGYDSDDDNNSNKVKDVDNIKSGKDDIDKKYDINNADSSNINSMSDGIMGDIDDITGADKYSMKDTRGRISNKKRANNDNSNSKDTGDSKSNDDIDNSDIDEDSIMGDDADDRYSSSSSSANSRIPIKKNDINSGMNSGINSKSNSFKDSDKEEDTDEDYEEEITGDMDGTKNVNDKFYEFKSSSNGINKNYINRKNSNIGNLNDISNNSDNVDDNVDDDDDDDNSNSNSNSNSNVDSISEGISDDAISSGTQMSSKIQQQHFDFAVWPRGGRVVPPGQTAFFFGETLVLTALPYIVSLGTLKRIRYNLKLDRESADESVLISHNMIAGSAYSKEKGYSCYAFKGPKGAVTVTLHSAVKVSEVQILYSPKPNDRHMENAPKSIQLIGWTDLPSSLSRSQGVNLGLYQYNISDPSGTTDPRSWELQSFLIPDIKTQGGDSYPPFRAVTVYVLSNHGDVSQTRICRVKVLGELAY